MDFYAVSALINASTSLMLGLFVFFKDRKSKTNNAFILMTASVFFWSICYFFWQVSTDNFVALVFVRLLSIGSTLIPILYLNWVLSFLGVKDKGSENILIFGYGISLFFLFFAFSPDFIRGVESNNFFPYWPVPGFLYSTYLVLSYALLVGYGIYQLINNYYKTTGLVHYQIKYILIGSLFGFIGGLTNFFLWYGIPIPPFGNIVVSLYVFILFYAMMKYRLMDMRVIARQLFIYFGISVLTYAFFYALIIFYDTFFGGVFTLGSYMFGVLVAPLFVMLFYNASKSIHQLANKYFFTSLYNYQETISKLAEDLTSHIELKTIVRLIMTTITETMNVGTIGLFLINKDGGYEFFKGDKVLRGLIVDDVVGYCRKNKEPAVADELQYHYERNMGNNEFILRLYCWMRDKKIGVCLPLIVGKKMTGLIVLGEKNSRNPYTKEDLELLVVLSKQAGIAIENARQYEQIQDFGKMLQSKVDEQVKDIKEKNEHLQELLIMRSDFLKVISHQLNTPLSIIRGYLSMMKEGDYKAEEALPVIEMGMYRIINTVNDFCEAYKLEGENPVMSFQKTNIEGMVKEIIKEKSGMGEVKDKKLKILIKKPGFRVPTVYCDPERIKRVLESLIDNAIVYTEKGFIEISYEVIGKSMLKISIMDTGCGISLADKDRMFQKFSRGIKAPSIHQNGSGLGLYIAKKIIEGNGGEIWYESEGEGMGSIFSFTLKVAGKD